MLKVIQISKKSNCFDTEKLNSMKLVGLVLWGKEKTLIKMSHLDLAVVHNFISS